MKFYEKNLEPLPEKIAGRGEVKGFEFNLIKRSDKVAIYSVKVSPKSKNLFYEVFLRVGSLMYGKEYYPRSSNFSSYAKSTPSLERAEELFKFFENKTKRI